MFLCFASGPRFEPGRTPESPLSKGLKVYLFNFMFLCLGPFFRLEPAPHSQKGSRSTYLISCFCASGFLVRLSFPLFGVVPRLLFVFGKWMIDWGQTDLDGREREREREREGVFGVGGVHDV